MYLIIMEDGSLVACTSISEDEKTMVNNGYIDVVRFHEGQFEQWYENQWLPIKEDNND